MAKPSKTNTAARLGGLLSNLTEQSAGAFPEMPAQEVAEQAAPKKKRRFITIRLDQLRPNPFQPRKDFSNEEELRELGESIKTHGLQQPLIVRAATDAAGMYDLGAGERRWRAMHLVGLTEADAIEVLDCSDEELETIALIENVHRTDLSPYELAEAYWKLHRAPNGTIRRSIAEVADQVKRKVDHVDSHLAIMRVEPKIRQLIIDDPTIPVRTIRDLGQVKNANDLDYLIEEVRNHRYTANDISRMLQLMKKAQKRAKQQTEGADAGAELASPKEEIEQPETQGAFSAQQPPTSNHVEHKASVSAPAERNGHADQPLSLPIQSQAAAIERTIEEHTASAKETTSEVQKPTPSPALALAQLEMRLRKDDTQLRKIIGAIAEEVPYMTSDQKTAVKNQTQTWLALIQQIQEQARED